MKIKQLLLLSGFTSLLVTTPIQAQQVATVDGEQITQKQLDSFIATNYPDAASKPENRQALDEMIRLQLVKKAAQKDGLEKHPDYLKQKQELEEQLLISFALTQLIEKNPITEDSLLTTYKKLTPRLSAPEYKARHILVDDEAKAKDLIKQLDKGAKFEELAKQHSTGPSGPQGGDLGWFNPKQMVPQFSQALASLKKGQYSSSPTQTQFGWHVILMEDQRLAEPPPFVSLKPQLEKQAQQQLLAQYLQTLYQRSNITISLPTKP